MRKYEVVVDAPFKKAEIAELTDVRFPPFLKVRLRSAGGEKTLHWSALNMGENFEAFDRLTEAECGGERSLIFEYNTLYKDVKQICKKRKWKINKSRA